MAQRRMDREELQNPGILPQLVRGCELRAFGRAPSAERHWGLGELEKRAH